MFDNHDISPTDQQPGLAARIDRRRQIARTALAAFDGDRLALIAAVARQTRAAHDASRSEPATPAQTGRPTPVIRPLLAD
ncbi:MAG: hypothetical protein QOH68_2940 [Nocardioidaceae bacterium]|jgi:hypothetical protein|nr:hypothetical protein [Nocardioidaceae bacterium]